MREDVVDFVNTFDLVNNALQMRTLHRWNGRDLHNKENLSEHTHLVIACLIDLLEDLEKLICDFHKKYEYSKLIKAAMVHDSMELLRGDILSITKDTIPGLRNAIDAEEYDFMKVIIGNLNKTEQKLLKLADLKACYKFIEYELRNPSCDYIKSVYITCKEKFDAEYKEFLEDNGITDCEETVITDRYIKGYIDDAGMDIILKEDVTFLPLSTVKIDLDVKYVPQKGQMALLCSRTSAANNGLIVAMCPIDANYNGTITAIVHNVSNKVVTYLAGQAFCQLVCTPIIPTIAKVKKQGVRSDGKLGSTGI